MPHWKNGGPQRLYVAVNNETGAIHAFYKARLRADWLGSRGRVLMKVSFTLLTYDQRGA